MEGVGVSTVEGSRDGDGEGAGASTVEGSREGAGEGAAVGTDTAVADGKMMREKMGRSRERRRRF